MEKIKAAFFYLFYALYNFFKISDDRFNEHKAALSVMIISIILTTRILDLVVGGVSSMNYASIKILGILICAPIAIATYYLFIIRKSWRPFVEKFDSMPNSSRYLANFGVISFLGFFIWFCFVS